MVLSKLQVQFHVFSEYHEPPRVEEVRARVWRVRGVGVLCLSLNSSSYSEHSKLNPQAET